MSDCKDCNPDIQVQEGEALVSQEVQGDCAVCAAVLTSSNRARWGITRPVADIVCECHMICVQDVLLICARDNQTVDIPVCVCVMAHHLAAVLL